ncbi:MAG: apolipoprotein N-acyltransferase [Candidatus Kryptoniota bacterium]
MIKANKLFNSNLGLCIFSGLLLGFSFPPFHFGLLAFVGFVPLLFVMDNAENYKEVFKQSYFGFLAFNIVAIYWVGGWTREADPFLMIGGAGLVLGHPLFFTIPMLVYHFVHRRLGPKALFFFPFLYLSFEHLHSITEVAFPWLTVGYSQSYNLSDIQFASFTGLFGLSFQILLVNSFIYYALISWMEDRKKKRIQIAVSLSSAFLLIVIPEIYGLNILRTAKDLRYSNTLNVMVVQPNIDPYAKWSGTPSQILEEYENETYEARVQKPDLVVWPETAIPFYILLPQNYYFKHHLLAFLDSTGVSLLSGAPLATYYSKPDEAKVSSHYDEFARMYYDAYNGAALFEPRSNEYQTYGKIILVPFGERIPYADAVPFLIKPLNWGVGISNWARGKDTTVFNLKNGITFSTVICYESIFPNYVREFVKKGANFLVIITNDGWYGKSSGPYQHATYAVLRAVENRRSVVRAANTGISEFIDPYGRYIGKQTRLDEKATLTAEIPIDNQITFYTEHGDWIAHVSEIISAGAILIGLFLKFRSKNKGEVLRTTLI